MQTKKQEEFQHKFQRPEMRSNSPLSAQGSKCRMTPETDDFQQKFRRPERRSHSPLSVQGSKCRIGSEQIQDDFQQKFQRLEIAGKSPPPTPQPPQGVKGRPSSAQEEFQHKFQRPEIRRSHSPLSNQPSKCRTSPVQVCRSSCSPSRDSCQGADSSSRETSVAATSEEDSEQCDAPSEPYGLKGGNCSMICMNTDDGQVESQKLYAILQNFVGSTQRDLKCEVEQLRCQLHCQRKAMECLNQTVGGLQSQSSQHIQRIEQLREDTKMFSTDSQETRVECMMEEKIQEVWRAMMKELANLKDYIKQWSENEQCNRNEALDAISRELQESKTFLWKEVENLRADLEDVQSRLGCQEIEICNHQADIKTMKHIQAKSRKVLRQLVGSTADVIPDCPEMCCPPVCRENMEKEIESIWSTMSCLQSELKKISKSGQSCVPQGPC